METTAIIILVYGTIVLLGGVLGWVKAKSKPSLIAGLVFGGALNLCGLAIWAGQPAARLVALTLAIVLLVVMGKRFCGSKKFMPAGMVAMLSVGVVIYLVSLLIRS